MRFGRTIGVAALLSTLLLSACATLAAPGAEPAPAPETAAPEPTPTTPPSEEPEDVETSPYPAGLFDLTCDDVVPLDRVRDLLGGDMTTLDVSPVGFSPGLIHSSAAIADGALSCQWAPSGENFATMTLTASIASPEEYATSFEGYDLFPRPSPPLPILDGARAECSEMYPSGTLVLECGWNVYFDGVWIVAQFTGLPSGELVEPAVRVNPDTSSNKPTANPEGQAARILIDAAATLARSESSAPSRMAPAVSCDELGAGTEVPAALGVPASVYNNGTMEPDDLGGTTAWSGGMLTLLGVERQGWTDCLFVFDSIQTISVTYAPAAGWILSSDPYPGLTVAALENDEGASSCTLDEGGSVCSVALARGDDLIVINARQTSDLESVLRFARSVSATVDDLIG